MMADNTGLVTSLADTRGCTLLGKPAFHLPSVQILSAYIPATWINASRQSAVVNSSEP
jgi:hypothetical protein